jgi:hypothetical protein
VVVLNTVLTALPRLHMKNVTEHHVETGKSPGLVMGNISLLTIQTVFINLRIQICQAKIVVLVKLYAFVKLPHRPICQRTEQTCLRSKT